MNPIQSALSAQLLVEQHYANNKSPLPDEYCLAVHKVLDGITSDPAYFDTKASDKTASELPHPERNLYTGLVPLPLLFSDLGVRESAELSIVIMDELRREELRLHEVVARLIQGVPAIRKIAMNSHSAGMGVHNAGAITNILVPHAWLINGKPVFQIENELATALTKTSFGADTPTNFVRSPVRFSYIEFGDKRDLGIDLFNTDSGWHPIEGCYISESRITAKAGTYPLLDFIVERGFANHDSPTLRFLDLQFTGSPVGKSNNMDDTTHDVTLFIDDDRCRSLGELVDCHMDYYRQQSQFSIESYRPTDINESHESSLREGIELLVKSLIFINGGLTEQTKILNRPPLLRSIRESKSTAKVRKLKQRLDKARDYILISPKEKLKATHNGLTTGSKSVHWRRGHLRNQAVGPGRAETKIVWIQPTLVGGDSATVKSYKVKS